MDSLYNNGHAGEEGGEGWGEEGGGRGGGLLKLPLIWRLSTYIIKYYYLTEISVLNMEVSLIRMFPLYGGPD